MTSRKLDRIILNTWSVCCLLVRTICEAFRSKSKHLRELHVFKNAFKVFAWRFCRLNAPIQEQKTLNFIKGFQSKAVAEYYCDFMWVILV